MPVFDEKRYRENALTPTRMAGVHLETLLDAALADPRELEMDHAIAAYAVSVVFESSLSSCCSGIRRFADVRARLENSAVDEYRALAALLAAMNGTKDPSMENRAMTWADFVANRANQIGGSRAYRVAAAMIDMACLHHALRSGASYAGDTADQIMARSGVERREPTTLGDLAARGDFDNTEYRAHA